MSQEIFEKVRESVASVKDSIAKRDELVDKLDQRLRQIELSSQRKGMFGGGDRGPDDEFEGVETKAAKVWARTGTVEKGLSTTDDGQGVVVRADWSDRIFKLIRESSPVRQAANVQQTTSNELEVLVDRGEPDSGWVAEKGTRSPTTASFLTRQTIPVFEHYAYPEVTLHMLEDSRFNVEGWLSTKLGTRFGRQEASAFMVGDGNGKPRGILDYDLIPDESFTWVADPDDYVIGAYYSAVDGGLATDGGGADVLYDVVDGVKGPYLSGAVWMMTRKFRNIVRKLKDSEDRYLFQPALSQGVPDTLLGYPVMLAEDMPTPAMDVVGALFGNFAEAYTVADRIEFSVQRDAITKPGFVKWYARRRVGGALTNPEAIKALVLGSISTA